VRVLITGITGFVGNHMSTTRSARRHRCSARFGGAGRTTFYNLCSGRPWSIQQVLELLIGASTVKGMAVEADPERLRTSDAMILEGDPSKIEKGTGWKVAIPFERTLRELLDDWRERVRPAAR
jgi:nucleoside-diphosphate-sugar epimerase